MWMSFKEWCNLNIIRINGCFVYLCFSDYIDTSITMSYTHVKRVICNLKTTQQHVKMYINSRSNYRASLQMVSRKTAVYISPLSCLTDNCNCRNPLPFQWSKHRAIALTYFIPPHSHSHTHTHTHGYSSTQRTSYALFHSHTAYWQ